DFFEERGGDWARQFGALPGGIVGLGDWTIAWRHDGICDQSCERFGAAGGPCDFAGRREGRVGLGVCADSGDRAAPWRRSGWLATAHLGCYLSAAPSQEYRAQSSRKLSSGKQLSN